MTISSLAKKIEIPRAVVSQIINGRRLSEKTEQRIADYLEKPVADLFPERSPNEIKKMRSAEAKQKEKSA
jgi:plasmid maintenance system antidote protein VapI